MPALRKPFPDRWWYHGPRTRSYPWRLKLMRSTDEYCNPTFYLGLPAVGAFVFRYRRGPIRTQACDTCQNDMGPWCGGCESCHEGPRCHPWNNCTHTVITEDCPVCRGWFCPVCEPVPKDSCPYKEKP